MARFDSIRFKLGKGSREGVEKDWPEGSAWVWWVWLMIGRERNELTLGFDFFLERILNEASNLSRISFLFRQLIID